MKLRIIEEYADIIRRLLSLCSTLIIRLSEFEDVQEFEAKLNKIIEKEENV